MQVCDEHRSATSLHAVAIRRIIWSPGGQSHHFLKGDGRDALAAYENIVPLGFLVTEGWNT